MSVKPRFYVVYMLFFCTALFSACKSDETLGSIIIYRLKRFHIVATYVPLFVLSAFVVTLWQGNSFWTNLSPITVRCTSYLFSL